MLHEATRSRLRLTSAPPLLSMARGPLRLHAASWLPRRSVLLLPLMANSETAHGLLKLHAASWSPPSSVLLLPSLARDEPIGG